VKLQHGSGMHQIFDAIARSHGFDESTIPMGYLHNLNIPQMEHIYKGKTSTIE
jgi:hypothetical protein